MRNYIIDDIIHTIGYLLEAGMALLILGGFWCAICAIVAFFEERKRQKKERQEEEKRQAERQAREAERQKREAQLNAIAAQWEKHPLFPKIFSMCNSVVQNKVTLIKTGAYRRAGDYRRGDGERPVPWNECKCAVQISVNTHGVTVYDKCVNIIYNKEERFIGYAFDEKYEEMNPMQQEALLWALYRTLKAKCDFDESVAIRYGGKIVDVDFSSLLPKEKKPDVQPKIPLPK